MRKRLIMPLILALSCHPLLSLAENIPCPSPSEFSGVASQMNYVDGVAYGMDKGRWAKTLPITLSDGHLWAVNIGPIQDRDSGVFDQDYILRIGRAQLKTVLPARPRHAEFDRALGVYVCDYPTQNGFYRAQLFLVGGA